MAGRVLVFLTLFLLATATATRADGVDLTLPNGYVTADASWIRTKWPVNRMWTRTIGGVRHTILASSVPFSGDIDAVSEAMKAYVAARGGGVSASEAAPPLCGARSSLVTYTYAQHVIEVFRSVSTGGHGLLAIYARPDGSAPDGAALAALETLCSGVHQPAVPAGWRVVPSTANSSVFTLGGGASAFTSTATAEERAAPPSEASAAPPSLVRDEPCGFVMIRHRVAATDGKTTETVTGTVRGYRYVNVYTRPRSAPAEAGAITALRSFCAETSTAAAPAASPAPSASP